MREIRFRAWHAMEARMLYDHEYSFETGGREGYLTIRDTNGDMIIGNSTTVMQYTGLKDKNGKGIYEGDIVISETGQTAPVEWIPVGFWGLNHYVKHPGPGKVLKKSFGRQTKVWRIRKPKSWQVIGNRYENPELLEGAK